MDVLDSKQKKEKQREVCSMQQNSSTFRNRTISWGGVVLLSLAMLAWPQSAEAG
jgi:hypothetical protein